MKLLRFLRVLLIVAFVFVTGKPGFEHASSSFSLTTLLIQKFDNNFGKETRC